MRKKIFQDPNRLKSLGILKKLFHLRPLYTFLQFLNFHEKKSSKTINFLLKWKNRSHKLSLRVRNLKS